MSFLPEDDKARKMIPLFEYFTRYFPKAHREVAKVCVVNNVRYNPDRAPADINWARGKSPNQLGSAFRHILERQVDGKVFEAVPPEVAQATGIERVYVLAEAMWRIGAQLEHDIEAEETRIAARLSEDNPPGSEVMTSRGPVVAHGPFSVVSEVVPDAHGVIPLLYCNCDACSEARKTGV